MELEAKTQTLASQLLLGTRMKLKSRQNQLKVFALQVLALLCDGETNSFNKNPHRQRLHSNPRRRVLSALTRQLEDAFELLLCASSIVESEVPNSEPAAALPAASSACACVSRQLISPTSSERKHKHQHSLQQQR